MTKLVVASAIAIMAAHAPVQCTRSPDPDTRLEDQPGDALFALAEKFRAEGNTAAADSTLRYLIEKYPSDRHTPLAKEILAGKAPATTSAPPSSGSADSAH